MQEMQPHPLGIFLGKICAKFRQLSKIWAKVIKIVPNLIRFGQNQILASPKTFDLLRLCVNSFFFKNASQKLLIRRTQNFCLR